MLLCYSRRSFLDVLILSCSADHLRPGLTSNYSVYYWISLRPDRVINVKDRPFRHSRYFIIFVYHLFVQTPVKSALFEHYVTAHLRVILIRFREYSTRPRFSHPNWVKLKSHTNIGLLLLVPQYNCQPLERKRR